MATVLLTFVVLLLVFAAMAFGVLFGRAPIKGSCGGIGVLGGERSCQVCGGDPAKCPEPQSGGGKGVTMFDPRDRG